jgi:hypothetical protein
MGIDFGEYRPGQLALLITNFQNEPDTLLRLDRPRHPTASLLFSDVAVVEGVYGPSRSLLKFGAFYFDYDLDGRLDLLTCNGHLEPDISKVQGDVSYPQPVQLFWNNGADRRRYDPVTAKEAGDDLFHPLVGRGAAFADLDGDGHLTVALTSNGGPARLLRCEGGTGNHWVRLVLKGDGVHSNRSAIGAVVTVKAGDQVLRREVLAGRGYLSQSELPLTIGIGKATKVDSVTIRWPGRDVGEPQVVTEVKVDQENVIEQAAKK